jgi:hypothetical protein
MSSTFFGVPCPNQGCRSVAMLEHVPDGLVGGVLRVPRGCLRGHALTGEGRYAVFMRGREMAQAWWGGVAGADYGHGAELVQERQRWR